MEGDGPHTLKCSSALVAGIKIYFKNNKFIFNISSTTSKWGGINLKHDRFFPPSGCILLDGSWWKEKKKKKKDFDTN